MKWFTGSELQMGGKYTDIESTGLTIVVPEDMELLLANAKKDLFYDCTQSEMIRKLVMAGLEALDEKAKKEKLQNNRER